MSMLTANVLIADDEARVRYSLRERFEREGYAVIEAASAPEALERLTIDVDLILLEFRLGGVRLLRRIKQQSPEAAVILTAAAPSVDTAVEGMRLGAVHYVAKPIDVDAIALLASAALETVRLRREVRALRGSHRTGRAFDAIVGRSTAVQAIKALIARVAATPASSVLLTGETGTGKDLAARAIHDNSARAARPFVNITCSALPEQLLESELFGHERGAFTDARQHKKGLFETADGGTLFLDEVGEITPTLQAKLLRFLEEKTFKRVGGLIDIHVDVRVIAATNRDLTAEVGAGRFREDLFYRLQVMPIELPPLRERCGDVPLLASHFLGLYSREFKRALYGLTPAANSLLDRYDWPGNVRELRNAVERAVLLATCGWLEPADFASIAPSAPAGFRLPANGVKLEDLERQLLMQALERTAGHQGKAAELLGLNRHQVRYRIEKFGLAVV